MLTTVLPQIGDKPSSRVLEITTSDPAFAPNWSRTKKLYIVTTVLFINFNTCLSSSLPSGALPTFTHSFHLTHPQTPSLLIGIFLIGYIFGPILFGPMSESLGRRTCLLTSFSVYTISTLACALAPNWSFLLVMRLVNGIGASAPQYVLGGLFADLYPGLVERGRAVMVSGLVNNLAPLGAPIIAGFSSVEDWRWMFWIALILGGVNWPLLIFMPETLAPLIRRRLQKEAQSDTQIEFEKSKSTVKTVTVVFGRPLLGIGGIIAMFIFLWYDRYLAHAKARGVTWAFQEEYRRLPLACAGGPCFAISLFWLGWTADPSIHWSVPALSGLMFGIGIDLTFMALTNYLTDAYDIFSASALASSVFTRNISAALLVSLVSYQMYEKLGVGWACTLLGLVCVVLSVVPFAFIKYGPKLRERSPFCQKLTMDRNGTGDGREI